MYQIRRKCFTRDCYGDLYDVRMFSGEEGGRAPGVMAPNIAKYVAKKNGTDRKSKRAKIAETSKKYYERQQKRLEEYRAQNPEPDAVVTKSGKLKWVSDKWGEGTGYVKDQWKNGGVGKKAAMVAVPVAALAATAYGAKKLYDRRHRDEDED